MGYGVEHQRPAGMRGLELQPHFRVIRRADDFEAETALGRSKVEGFAFADESDHRLLLARQRADTAAGTQSGAQRPVAGEAGQIDRVGNQLCHGGVDLQVGCFDGGADIHAVQALPADNQPVAPQMQRGSGLARGDDHRGGCAETAGGIQLGRVAVRQQLGGQIQRGRAGQRAGGNLAGAAA